MFCSIFDMLIWYIIEIKVNSLQHKLFCRIIWSNPVPPDVSRDSSRFFDNAADDGISLPWNSRRFWQQASAIRWYALTTCHFDISIKILNDKESYQYYHTGVMPFQRVMYTSRYYHYYLNRVKYTPHGLSQIRNDRKKESTRCVQHQGDLLFDLQQLLM